MEDPISEMRRILSDHPQCVVVYMNMGTFTALIGLLPDTHCDAGLGQYMVIDGKEIRLCLATPEGDAHVVDGDWSVIHYHGFPVMSI